MTTVRKCVHITNQWVVILIALTTGITVLLQTINFTPASAISDNYPWPNAPCASSGSNLGQTSGTGYWCSNYNWGQSTCPAGDNYCTTGNKMNGYYQYDQWGEGFRNCVSYTSWMLSQTFNVNPSNWGNGTDWNNSALAAHYTDDSSPQIGDVAQWNGTKQNQWGHVAYVYNVVGNVAYYAEYNYAADGNFLNTYTSTTQGSPSNYIHFGTVNPQDNTVLQVKKLTASDGTNEVVWSKNTDVNESWWNSNSGGVQLGNLIHISQGDIKSFDVALYSSGEHDLFTATANNVWETWWYPGQGLHTSEILTNIGNIRKIIKSVAPDGVTQQLYVTTDTGAYEYWWNSGSNGIQHDTIMTLANPVDEYKEIEADGTQALFVADQNYPYELHWGNGINGIQQTTFLSVSGITSISYSQDSDTKHRLYVGSSTGNIWEDSWYPNGSIGYWNMTGGAPVLSLQKWEDDSEQVIYEATTGGVYEYYWPTTSNTLKGDTIIGLNNVHAFVRSTDPGGVQSVYTATGTNIDETWWYPGQGLHTGQIE